MAKTCPLCLDYLEVWERDTNQCFSKNAFGNLKSHSDTNTLYRHLVENFTFHDLSLPLILIQFSELFSSTKGREFDNKIGKYSNAAPMSVPPSLSTH